jgi:hypothetical protein
VCSWLEGPGSKICTLLIGPPTSQAWWDDCLGEAAEWLVMDIAKWHQVDA